MKGNVSTFNLTLTLFTTLGSFLYGFNSAIMGTVFGLPSWYEYFHLDTKGAGATYANNIIGSVNGIWSGGGIIGCVIIPLIANKFGRKPAIEATAVLCLVAVILQVAAVHVAMLLIGRLLGGVSAAMINCVVPMYQSEIAPAKSRGRLVGLHGFCIVIGYAAAGWAGLGCYFETNPQVQWRLCLGLQLIAPLALLIGSMKIPESPRHLMRDGRDVEALQLLCKLHHSDNDPQDLLAREEALQIKRQLEIDEQMPQGFFGVMQVPSYRKRFIIGIGVQCLAQSTGVLVVNNYQVILLNGLGVTGYMPLLLYAVYASWAAILNLVSALIVDRAGRVRLLTIGLGGSAMMMMIYTALVANYSGTTNKTGQALAVLFLYLYVTFYAGCLDAVTYVYCSEIFPTQLRASGVAASVAGLFATTLLYTQPAPIAFATIGWKYYLIFIIVPICGLPLLWFFCPETKGLSLEEIGACFGESVAVDITHMSSEEKQKLDNQLLNQYNMSADISVTKTGSVSHHEEKRAPAEV